MVDRVTSSYTVGVLTEEKREDTQGIVTNIMHCNCNYMCTGMDNVTLNH